MSFYVDYSNVVVCKCILNVPNKGIKKQKKEENK